MHYLSGGMTDASLSLGVVSLSSNGGWGYIGKKGNSLLSNIGYGMGIISFASDVLTGFSPSEVELHTENLDAIYQDGDYDWIGHSQLVDKNGTVLVDYGTTGRWMFAPKGQNDWTRLNGARVSVEEKLASNQSFTNRFSSITIKGVNVNRLRRIGSFLDKHPGRYNVLLRSCSSVSARSLFWSGVPMVTGIHPYALYAQMYLRSMGVHPLNYSYYLQQ